VIDHPEKTGSNIAAVCNISSPPSNSLIGSGRERTSS
jgi:hypothetical protein